VELADDRAGEGGELGGHVQKVRKGEDERRRGRGSGGEAEDAGLAVDREGAGLGADALLEVGEQGAGAGEDTLVGFVVEVVRVFATMVREDGADVAVGAVELEAAQVHGAGTLRRGSLRCKRRGLSGGGLLAMLAAMELLAALWQDYAERTPQARAIHAALAEVGEVVVNDHVALRGFAGTRLGIEELAGRFVREGWRFAGEYRFVEKKLDARHLAHPEPGRPKIFLSELRVGGVFAAAARGGGADGGAGAAGAGDRAAMDGELRGGRGAARGE
jgi:hypothetical protein